MSKNNIHVLSRGVIIDQDHILLCRTLDLPISFYFLPGGHVEHGESIETSLLRELMEETGAHCKIKRFLGCLEYSFEPGHSSICHNHEYNFIFELLQYDGYAKIPDFAWDTIARIRAEVFNFLTHHTKNSYVLTNCLADTQEDRKLYGQVEQMAQTRGALFIPVQIQISKEEHLKRLTQPERRERWKSIDPSDAEDNGPLIYISHPNLFSLNVSNLSPENAVEAIMNHINELRL